MANWETSLSNGFQERQGIMENKENPRMGDKEYRVFKWYQLTAPMKACNNVIRLSYSWDHWETQQGLKAAVYENHRYGNKNFQIKQSHNVDRIPQIERRITYLTYRATYPPTYRTISYPSQPSQTHPAQSCSSPLPSSIEPLPAHHLGICEAVRRA